ncbi:MAG: hypothetical protein HIU81_11025 [Acidobacteria bacterium]|nr:hypothetical protein [Acidobacteriota bacterium]
MLPIRSIIIGLLTAGLLSVGVVTAATATPAKSHTPTTTEAATSTTYSGQTVVGWASQNFATVPTDEAALGKQNGMLSTYVDFAGSSVFPADYAAAAQARSAALLIAWEPWDSAVSSTTQPAFKPTKITAGAYDSYITSWLKQAQAAAGKGSVLVRFAPEMNDAGRPWSVSTNGGNTAADYLAMWKHVYAIKKKVAPAVKMVWNPLVYGADIYGNTVQFSSVYPGSGFVDVLALDGFNWADTLNPGTCGWQSYSDIFSSAVTQIKSLAGGKPWGIAETASVDRPDSFFNTGGPCYGSWGSWVYDWPASPPFYATTSDWITQAGWVKTMIEQAHADGALFVDLFNLTKEADWRLNATPEGDQVMGTIAVDSMYVFGGQNASAYISAATN